MLKATYDIGWTMSFRSALVMENVAAGLVMEKETRWLQKTVEADVNKSKNK